MFTIYDLKFAYFEKTCRAENSQLGVIIIFHSRNKVSMIGLYQLSLFFKIHFSNIKELNLGFKHERFNIDVDNNIKLYFRRSGSQYYRRPGWDKIMTLLENTRLF